MHIPSFHSRQLRMGTIFIFLSLTTFSSLLCSLKSSARFSLNSCVMSFSQLFLPSYSISKRPGNIPVFAAAAANSAAAAAVVAAVAAVNMELNSHFFIYIFLPIRQRRLLFFSLRIVPM